MQNSNRIVVDWGSSNFRAYRFGADGAVLDRHQADAGILAVTDGRFEEMLERQIGTWITPSSEILFSGMITSRNGWVETPYVVCPATLGSIAAGGLARSSTRGATMRFLPGVSTLVPMPDVMRGEEIQVFGSVGEKDTATVVLPGTHSKWVEVADGAIIGLRTMLTGELYALLRQHSIVGRLIPAGEAAFDEAAFAAGVHQAQDKHSISLLNDVFTARAGALLGAFPPADIAARLSGMVIGHELKAGLALRRDPTVPLLLVGESNLTARYATALALLGEKAEIGPPHAAVDGFKRLSMLDALA